MKKRLLKVALIFAALGMLLAAFIVVGDIFPSFVVCPVRRFLHLKCPGCGMTGAIGDMIKMDFHSAFRRNIFFLPILLYLGYVFAPFCVRYVKHGDKTLSPKPEWLNVTFLAALVVWTVVRNIINI